jgi:hypothetical protein
MTTGGGRLTVLDGTGTPRIVNFDPAQLAGTVRQAVVVLQLVNELTWQPVAGTIGVSTRTAGLDPVSSAGGYAGLVAVPARAFPNLAAQSYAVNVALDAAGYTRWTGTLNVAAQAGFPNSFAAGDPVIVAMRRRPVRVTVIAVSLDAQNRPQPLSGATVRISSVWRRIADLTGAGVAAELISVPLGVSQSWPVGTALDSVSLLGPAEPTRRLAAGASPGERRLDVDLLGALVAGDLVGLDTSDLDRREYLPVTAANTTDVASPATLQTGGPVRVSHARYTTARRVPAPPGALPDATVTDAAAPGDTTVFVDTVTPFATVEMLRASGGALIDEFLDAHLYQATSDATGAARLPDLSRVAAVEITATKGPLTATARFTPDYSSPANSVVLTLQ